jgi:glucose uptake protein GlcU
MKNPGLNTVLTTARRTIGYAVGSLLFGLGILGFVVEVSEGKASSTICAGYMMSGVFLIAGTFLLLAVWSHYGGGIYSFIGATLIALVMMHIGFTMDKYLRGRYYLSPFTAILPVAIGWVIGCYCLVWGHMRHRRKKTTPPNTVLKPTPAP